MSGSDNKKENFDSDTDYSVEMFPDHLHSHHLYHTRYN